MLGQELVGPFGGVVGVRWACAEGDGEGDFGIMWCNRSGEGEDVFSIRLQISQEGQSIEHHEEGEMKDARHRAARRR